MLPPALCPALLEPCSPAALGCGSLMSFDCVDSPISLNLSFRINDLWVYIVYNSGLRLSGCLRTARGAQELSPTLIVLSIAGGLGC
jgi:hypothetical protein